MHEQDHDHEDVGELDPGSLAGVKALYSDARKRAAVTAGVGAYLYTALASVVLAIGPGPRQVHAIRRSGKSDLLVLSVDPLRMTDPEIAGEGERDRLTALVKRFSREDLLRAFALLTRAENDIRGAAQPRYHLEMALLRWIYLRKLVPIEDLIAGAPAASSSSSAARRGATCT